MTATRQMRNDCGVPTTPTSGPPTTAVDRVIGELRRELFDGTLPPGTPLREMAIAERFSVSRSTVREALTELVADGLADYVPNRGTQVRVLTVEAIRDVSRARVVLEVAGVRHWPHAAEEDREEVRRCLAVMAEVNAGDPTIAEINAAHLDVHRSLVGLIGSQRLVDFADDLAGEIRLALARIDTVRGDADEQTDSHQTLIEMLERGQIEEAAHELEHHHLAVAEELMLDLLADP